MDHPRMYRVIVVSGLGLAMPALTEACGSGGGGDLPTDASTDSRFPQEGPPPAGDAARVDSATLDGFPQEGPAVLPEASSDAPIDAAIDGFPQEGPPPLPDSGAGSG